jgi:AcrR family transcriptional regulator
VKRNPTPRAGAPRRAPLTRDAIAEAALAQIDAHGLEVFSMRRLGAALGVEAMALYHHFRGKGPLLDAVMERLLDEVEIAPRGSLPPLERLRRAMVSYRNLALTHPQAFILLVYRRFNTERTFQLYEQILEMFADAGFESPLAARFFRTLGYFVNGAGMADIASRAQQPDATPVKLEQYSDREKYPRVAAVAPHLRVNNLDAIFTFGLDSIFEAMKRAAAPARRTGR